MNGQVHDRRSASAALPSPILQVPVCPVLSLPGVTDGGRQWMEVRTANVQDGAEIGIFVPAAKAARGASASQVHSARKAHRGSFLSSGPATKRGLGKPIKILVDRNSCGNPLSIALPRWP